MISRERKTNMGRKPKPPRPLRFEGDVAFVPLTRGYEAKIDAEDAHLVDWRVWWARLDRRADKTIRTVYAIACDFSAERRALHLHRVIMNTPEGMVVDHLNGDGLDCRKSNMRNVCQAENTINRRLYRNNTSGRRGVSWCKKSQKWSSSISVNGRQFRIGTFDSKECAHAAYLIASAKLHGSFGEAAAIRGEGK